MIHRLICCLSLHRWWSAVALPGRRAFSLTSTAPTPVSNRDLRSYPTGRLASFGWWWCCLMQGAQNLTGNPVPYYDTCYYTGGTNGTMSSMNSTYVYGSVTFSQLGRKRHE